MSDSKLVKQDNFSASLLGLVQGSCKSCGEAVCAACGLGVEIDYAYDCETCQPDPTKATAHNCTTHSCSACGNCTNCGE